MVATAPLALAEDTPTYVYLTWATSDTAHTINVSWRTEGEYVGEVRYDTIPRGGDPDIYSYSTEGTGGVTTPELEGYIHHVELTGLEPDTIYYFICGNSDHGWSDEYSFRTAPDQGKSFRFVTGGDSRNDAFGEYIYWPWARDTLSSLAAERDPSFVLFSGDYLWSGEEPGQGYAVDDTWDNWLGAEFKYWRTTDGRLIPHIPVIGNHEVIYPEPQDYDPEIDATNYYTVFNLPGNERWYALSWGPDLRIIVLDSEVLDEDSNTWQEQLDWLESELENSEDYLWKVVAYHRPFVTTAVSKGQINFDRRIEGWSYLFTKYGVDLVVNGHVHYYERTCPVDSDPPSPWPEIGEEASPGEGVTYVISGGWGAPLYSAGAPKWFDAYGPDSTYHFCLIEIFENGTLHFQAIDVEGDTFDEFHLQKEAPGERAVDVSISPSEDNGSPGAVLGYEVTVTNTGDVPDNYSLESFDNAGWDLSISPSSLAVAAEASANATLGVAIPWDAVLGTTNNVTATATSQTDHTISDDASCLARVVLEPLFEYSNLQVASEEVSPGREVEVSIDTQNVGLAEGSEVVRLYINGELENSQEITLGPGEETTVTFRIIREELGTYDVEVENLTASFEVVKSPPGVSITTIAVIVIIIIVVVAVVWYQRTRGSTGG